ncbi:MFS transporter [Jiangella asiatica]|uniref:MFS transporter n=1 Tax=Jiangella asiatica TaxID=2530372 RepID=UPI0013A5D0B0|nr:MFS transporter [Jiangella asiatica]
MSRADTGRSIATIIAFGLALGASTVTFPLLALDAGISAPVVGALAAVSGASQLTSRLALPWLLERVPDRALIVSACVAMALSGATLLVSTAFAAFVGAQLLQGLARALFWTSSQTHAVRSPGTPIRRLAQVHSSGHVGSLAGPAAAGALLALSPHLALGLVVAAAVAGMVTGSLLVRRAPYARRPRGTRRSRLWRRRTVALGCWTSFCAGGWRGILDAFVPVVLATAGLSTATIGWLVAVAEGAVVVVAVALARYGREPFGQLVRFGAMAVLAGATVLPAVAGQPVLAGVALAVAGAGAGLAGSVGPAMVNASVHERDQGMAIALTGTYRAAARLATPAVLATAGGLVGVPLAIALTAAGMVAPVLGLGVVSRRPG